MTYPSCTGGCVVPSKDEFQEWLNKQEFCEAEVTEKIWIVKGK